VPGDARCGAAAPWLVFRRSAAVQVLRPAVPDSRAYRYVQHALRDLLRAFDRAYHAAFADRCRCAGSSGSSIGRSPDRAGSRLRDPSPMSRIDASNLPEQDVMHLTGTTPRRPPGRPYGRCADGSLPRAPGHAGIPAPLRRAPASSRRRAARAAGSIRAVGGGGAGAGARREPRIAILDWR